MEASHRVNPVARVWLRLANVPPFLGEDICLVALGKDFLIDKKNRYGLGNSSFSLDIIMSPTTTSCIYQFWFHSCELSNSLLFESLCGSSDTYSYAISLTHVVKKNMDFGIRFKFKQKLCNLFNSIKSVHLSVVHLLHWFVIKLHSTVYIYIPHLLNPCIY